MHYNVHIFTADLRTVNLFVAPESEEQEVDEVAVAGAVRANLQKLTGGRGGHLMPIFAKPSAEPPQGATPIELDGWKFYFMQEGKQ